MKPVFCDTFFFLAAINRSDQGHEQALAWSNAYDGPLLTTIWVITEVADALAGRQGRRAFEIFYQTLQADKRMRILTAQQSHFGIGVWISIFSGPIKNGP